MLPPPSHTPLVALPVLVLDLETTGLDVKNDRVIQIGALNMLGDAIVEQLFNQLIQPGVEIPAVSSKIHSITDSDVSTAPVLSEIAEPLKAALASRVVIGQHIGFDIAILRHEFSRHGLVWHEPTVLDISQLVGALQPGLPELSLETVTGFLGVEIQHRHTAMGDCLAAANAWQKLIGLLREKDIRTLGEALALANQRQDLIMQQIQSGWMSVPNELVISPVSLSNRIDSYVFEHRLLDVMSHPVTQLDANTSLRAAAQTMRQQNIGCVVIGENNQSLQGVLTEKDLLHVVAENLHDLDSTPVMQVMSRPVQTMHQHELLYRALARMDRLSISHVCVVDDHGAIVGIVSQRDLLQYRARSPHILSDAMEAAQDATSLAAAYARVTTVAAQLVNEDLNGCDVARVISTELQALTQRATQLSMARMRAEGRGEVPADWCVLVLGSGGRAESLLSADQDNALIHNGTADDDEWFAQFGRYLAELLDNAGLPLCKGGVMCSQPAWRGTLADWQQRLEHWLRRASPNDLLNVDIFFDLLPVAGNHELARQLHHDATQLASKTPTFTNLLAQSVQSFAPRFSLFGRLPSNEGRLDLKRDGLLPLVSLARTLALRIGSVSRATPERLRDVLAAGRVAEGDITRLIELHKKLLTLIVQQQIQDIDAGIAPGSRVEIKQFNRKQYAQLLREIHHLDTMVGEIQSLMAH